MTLPSFLLSLLSMSTDTMTKSATREFRFVPYGHSFPSNASNGRPTISCDGRIQGGVTLELTHWTGNETPYDLYADTSTEMALKFADTSSPRYKGRFDNALVLNNHYDTDGVLSVWACLDPHGALEYSQLLAEGAAAGDFGEWSSDQGVKLDCIIESFLQDDDEEEAYGDVLTELPAVLKDLQTNGGKLYQSRWNDGFETTLEQWEALTAAHMQQGPGTIVIVTEPSSSSHLSPYALDRGLREYGLWKGTTRLLCVSQINEGMYQYRYKMPGHGWVQKLVNRHMIAPPADGSKLAQQLRGDWKPSGGLTGICHTTQLLKLPPIEVASMLHQLDST